MRTLKNYLYSSLYQIFLIIVPLVTIPYVSRVLGAELIGINSYTNTILSYFVLLANLGIFVYGNRTIAYYRDSIEERSRKFWEIISLKLIVSFLVYLLFLLFTIVYPHYQLIFMIQSIQIMATALDVSWLFDGMEDFKRTVIRNFLVKVLSVICIFVFVTSAADFDKYVLITVGSLLLGNLTLWTYLHHYIIKVPLKTLNLKEHLIPIVGLFIPQIASTIFVSLNKILLGNLSNMVQVGYFENADKVIRVLLALIASVGVVIFPKVANAHKHKDHQKVLELTQLTFDAVNIITIPMVFGLIAISPLFSTIFFGPDFVGIDLVLSILAIELIFMGYSSVLGSQYLIATGQSKYLSWAVACGLVSTALFSFLFIPSFGALGGAISSVIGEASIMLAEVWLLRSQINIFHLCKDIPKYLLASLGMYIVLFFLKQMPLPTYLILCLSILLGAFVYAFLLLILRPRLLNVATGVLTSLNPFKKGN